MGYSYNKYHYCSSQCGPKKGWWAKYVTEEVNGVMVDKLLLFCPKNQGGCGKRLRLRNRDINRSVKSDKKQLLEKQLIN